MTITDEVRLGAGVAGIEDVAYPILSHQVLGREKRLGDRTGSGHIKGSIALKIVVATLFL